MNITPSDLTEARKYLQGVIADCLGHHAEDKRCESLAFAIERLVTVHAAKIVQDRQP